MKALSLSLFVLCLLGCDAHIRTENHDLRHKYALLVHEHQLAKKRLDQAEVDIQRLKQFLGHNNKVVGTDSSESDTVIRDVAATLKELRLPTTPGSYREAIVELQKEVERLQASTRDWATKVRDLQERLKGKPKE